MDAGVVGDATRVDCLNFQGSKGNNCVTNDVSCPNLNAMHGHDVHVVALDGDKLKPREDQRKGGNGFGINEEGAGYTLTGVDRHGVAYGMDALNTGLYGAGATGEEVSMTQDANQCKGGKCVVQIANGVSFDGRKDAPIADGVAHSQTIGTNPGFKDGVVQCFSKVSHPSAPNGYGERWDEREVAQTRNTFDNGEKRCQEVVVSTQGLDGYNKTLTGDVSPTVTAKRSDLHHVPGVVSTNSNGEDVAPTISSCEYKMGQKQKDTGGVRPHPPRGRSARWE